MTFFYLLNIPKQFIVYVHAKTIKELDNCLNNYLQNKNNDNKLYLIYSCQEGRNNGFKHDLIHLTYSSVSFQETLDGHNNSKNKIKHHVKPKLLKLYNNIGVTFTEVQNTLEAIGNPLKNNSIEQAILRCKTILSCPSNDHSSSVVQLNTFIKIVTDLFPVLNVFGFKEFLNNYRIPTHTRLFDRSIYKTITFNNVYYRNKSFYNKDGSFFNVCPIQQDIEYKNYNKTKLNIDTESAIRIEEPVLFLDYIYDFYNFGEFWDVVKRLIFLENSNISNCYGLKDHRILNINYYFEKANILFPPKYCRDYKSLDETRETERGSTVFFKEITFSIIENTCRSSLDPWVAYTINKRYNTLASKHIEPFILYLSRGNMPRGFAQEEEFLSKVSYLNNFKIIDGKETFEEQQYFFTNAKVIIGVHGALQANFVWNKNLAVFVELAPIQRCAQLCHYGDAVDCGFESFIIPCAADEKEIINLTEDKLNNLVEFVKVIAGAHSV